MAQFYYPPQNRYNDAYQQRITTPGTIYREKYLSRASNNIIKMIGDNLVISGLDVTTSFLGSVITLSLSPGLVIHDSTAIALTTTSTLDCTMTVNLPDTNNGACLAIFTDYQYIEPTDPEVQTPLKLSVYHVDADGVPTTFTGSPVFSVTRNKILVSVIDFIKSGAVVTSCQERVITSNESPSLTISGTDYYLKGVTSSNITFSEINNYVGSSSVSSFFAELLFQDYLRG